MADKSGFRRREPFGFSSDDVGPLCAVAVGTLADESMKAKRFSDRRSFDPKLEGEVAGHGDLAVATRRQTLSSYRQESLNITYEHMMAILAANLNPAHLRLARRLR